MPPGGAARHGAAWGTVSSAVRTWYKMMRAGRWYNPQSVDTVPGYTPEVALGPIIERDDGWLSMFVWGIGYVDVALATVGGVPQVVGLRLDIDPLSEWHPGNHTALPPATDSSQWSTEMVSGEAEAFFDWIATLPIAERRQWAVEHGLGRAITSARLRRLPLSELRAAAAAHLAGGDPWTQFKAVERHRGKPLPIEHFRQVADIYRGAVERRQSPLLAIQCAYGVSRPSASKYVRRARKLGFLGYPAKPGVAGADCAESPIRPRTSMRKRRRKP